MLSRRSLLTGLIAAPAVIRVAPLMRIAPLPLYGEVWQAYRLGENYEMLPLGESTIIRSSLPLGTWRKFYSGLPFGQLADRESVNG